MTLIKAAPIEELTAQKHCKSCGESLGPGRPDRQFCDAGCRSVYHNTNKSQKNEALKERKPATLPPEVTRIQQILLRNREILAELCGEQEKTAFKMKDLQGRGFNIKYYTSEPDPTKINEHIYRFCFEYGYRVCEDGYAVIVKRDREIAF